MLSSFFLKITVCMIPCLLLFFCLHFLHFLCIHSISSSLPYLYTIFSSHYSSHHTLWTLLYLQLYLLQPFTTLSKHGCRRIITYVIVITIVYLSLTLFIILFTLFHLSSSSSSPSSSSSSSLSSSTSSSSFFF